MSSESAIVPMDRCKQPAHSDGYSIASGFNTFRGLDFIKDPRLNKVKYYLFFCEKFHNFYFAWYKNYKWSYRA